MKDSAQFGKEYFHKEGSRYRFLVCDVFDGNRWAEFSSY